jgi:cob(I)alamin adenosyltransferase
MRKKKEINYQTGFYLRMSEQDKAKLKENAERFGYQGDSSKYIRAMIYQRPIDDKEIKSALSDLIKEVNKIGVNINQITHDYNAFLITQEQVDMLKQYMQQINQKMEKIRKKLYQPK